MNRIPTGQILRTAAGRDLVLTRTFRAPIDDVWASITESERTARWFGPWEGDAGVGKSIRYQMSFEATDAWSQMTIAACDPPRHLRLTAVDDYGSWDLELHLSETNGTTELRFVQHLDDGTDVGSVGPGWEYYLDNLVATRDGTPMPQFEEYYPAQKDYYQSQ